MPGRWLGIRSIPTNGKRRRLGFRLSVWGRPYSEAYGYGDDSRTNSAGQISNRSVFAGISKSDVVAAISSPLKGMDELSADWGLALRPGY
jgi:hypothetical protein